MVILSTKQDLVRCHNCQCTFITTHMQDTKHVMLRETNFTYTDAYVCPVCRHYIDVYGYGTKSLKAEYKNKKDIEEILYKVFSDFSRETISKMSDIAFEK